MESSSRQPDRLSDHELIIAFLDTHDGSCPRCQYNLRGIASLQCPECGENAIALRITSKSAPGRSYTVGLVGLSFSILLAVLFSIKLLPYFPLLSILSALGAVVLGLFLSRWHTNTRHTIGSLLRHKKQERVALAWLPAVVFAGLLLML